MKVKNTTKKDARKNAGKTGKNAGKTGNARKNAGKKNAGTDAATETKVEAKAVSLKRWDWKTSVAAHKGEIDTQADCTWLHAVKQIREDLLEAWSGLKIGKKTVKGWLLCNGVALRVSYDKNGVWTRQDKRGDKVIDVVGRVSDLEHLNAELVSDKAIKARFSDADELTIEKRNDLGSRKIELTGRVLARGEKGTMRYFAFFVELENKTLVAHNLESRHNERNANHRFKVVKGSL